MPGAVHPSGVPAHGDKLFSSHFRAASNIARQYNAPRSNCAGAVKTAPIVRANGVPGAGQRHSRMHEWSDGRQLQRGQNFCLEHDAEYERGICQRATSRLDVPELVFLRVHLGQLVRFGTGAERTAMPG